MYLPAHEIALAIASLALQATILVMGWRNPKLWSQLRYFYYFIAWNLLTQSGTWAWHILFPGHLEGFLYFHVLGCLRVASYLVQIFVLWRLYAAFQFHSDRLIWYSLTLATIIMVLFLSYRQNMALYGTYYLIQAGLLQFQILFCALILGHLALNNTLLLGWNHTALIFGLVISIAIDYIGLSLFTGAVISYLDWRPWKPILENIPVVIWAIALRGYSPSGSRPTSESMAMAEKDQEFEKAVRSLLQR